MSEPVTILVVDDQAALRRRIMLACLDVRAALKGGEGSGNFDHEGRPGEVGGSGPGGGKISVDDLKIAKEDEHPEYGKKVYHDGEHIGWIGKKILRAHQRTTGNISQGIVESHVWRAYDLQGKNINFGASSRKRALETLADKLNSNRENQSASSEKEIKSRLLLACLDVRAALKGGEGSGNFDHEGRPGEVGGSAPRGGISVGDSFNKEVSRHGKIDSESASMMRAWTENIQSGTLTRKKSEKWLLGNGKKQLDLKKRSQAIIRKLPSYDKSTDSITMYRVQSSGEHGKRPFSSWSPVNSKDSYVGKLSHGSSSLVKVKKIPVNSIVAIPQLSHSNFGKEFSQSYRDEWEVIVRNKN